MIAIEALFIEESTQNCQNQWRNVIPETRFKDEVIVYSPDIEHPINRYEYGWRQYFFELIPVCYYTEKHFMIFLDHQEEHYK